MYVKDVENCIYFRMIIKPSMWRVIPGTEWL